MAAAFILVAALAVPSCDDGGRGCTAIGCPGQGLDIVFDGRVAQETTLQIEIARVEPPNVSPIIQCILSGSADPDAGAEDLFCNSTHWISQQGRTLNTHETMTTVRISISSNGMQLSQETVTPTYTRTEPNGPRCGACVFSTIHVDLPQTTQSP